MSWEDQGRQEHGWFGNGTAPSSGKAVNDSLPAPSAVPASFAPPKYIAPDVSSHIGHGKVGDGECVALVRQATGAPPTRFWRPGDRIEAHPVPPGTAAATFDADGHYGNHLDGTSHAQIVTQWTENGFYALEQYNIRDSQGHVTHSEPPKVRFYDFRHSRDRGILDDSQYHAIQ